MKITAQLLDQFEKSRGVKDDCPYCGHHEWIVTGPTEGGPDAAIYINAIECFVTENVDGKSRLKRTGQFMQAIAAACENCGHIRLTSLGSVLNWISEAGTDKENAK